MLEGSSTLPATVPLLTDCPQANANAPTTESPAGESSTVSDSFEDHEKGLLVDALARAGGNQSEAARILKISRDRMRYKMAKYDLR